MPLTNAQRQARYRELNGEKLARINMCISFDAKEALEAIAKRLGCTQRQALEQALAFTLQSHEAPQ